MKKIACLLFLIQSGLMMAQTETVVTVNGKKVQVAPNAGTADNGLTADNGKIQLGGDLTKPTTLTTTAVNTLKIAGLQTGTTTDYLLTTDATGVVRQIANTSWSTKGNAGTNWKKDAMGTLDDQHVVFVRNGKQSGFLGANNTGFGYGTLGDFDDDGYNVAFGVRALSTGSYRWNVAIGYEALRDNIGNGNTAVGYLAGSKGYKANYNTFIGKLAGSENYDGTNNVAIGNEALKLHANGHDNIAIGSFALQFLTNGNNNLTTSLIKLTEGTGNVVFGGMSQLIKGGLNTSLGFSAGTGYGLDGQGMTQSNSSIFIGSNSKALVDNSNNEIVIGANAIGRGSNTVMIGDANITSIGGYTAWSNYSDSRLKKDVATSTYGLNFINKLRPVTYKMKKGTTDLQSGFIAQEVETAANSIGYQFSGIVKPQNDSDYYSLRYAEFVVPLVKAVQEQQKLIEDQQKLLGAKDAKILEIEKRLLLLEQKIK